MLKKTTTSTIHYILGSKDIFLFRERLFHALCVIMMVPIIQAIIQNTILGISLFILPWILALLYVFVCYVFSRFLKKFITATYLFVVGTIIVILVNYIYNDGINGPTMIGSFIPMTLIFVISSSRLKWVWAVLYVLLFGVLFYMEFTNVDFVKSHYVSLEHRYYDVYIAYVFSLLSVLIIAWFTQSSLVKEQKVSKQKSIELKKERQALKQLNDQQNKLFSIISHDLRKPLGNIISYLDLLDNKMLTESEKDLIKQDLNSNTKNTHQLLLNLLNWSRAQQNGFNFSPVEINLKKLFHTPLSLSKDLAKPKNISIVESYDPNARVKADKSLIDIIIRNLMQNAIKFSPSGSSIEFRAEKVGDQLIIQVIDEGPGIKNIDKEQISKKANDVSWHSTENNHGLGLHLCVMSASTHNGFIEALDNPNGGTIMKVTLSA